MKTIQFKTPNGENVYPIGKADITVNGDIRLPKVYITSDYLTPHSDTNIIDGLNESKNEVPCTIRLLGIDISFEDTGIIAYQGASSIAAPKKGFAIDTDKKHRFLSWVEMDSFHLKGYYTDWTHSRDLVNNRIYEQMMRSRIVNTRPFMVSNDFAGDYRQRIDSGALCHIDGFPCELFINNVYWGLYSWNIKKDRDNYLLDKKNTNHIQIETAGFTDFNSNFSWSTIEVRNPKSDSGNTSFEEGVEPNPGEVKTSWTNFVNFMNSITVNTSKVDIETYLNIDSFIDSLLLSDLTCNWDSFIHNSLYTSWDGIKYSILMYDLDLTWGIESRIGSAYPKGDILVIPTYRPFYRNTTDVVNPQYSNVMAKCVWFPILIDIYSDEINERYANLRNNIFTVDNIKQQFSNFTREVGINVYKDDLKRWTYPNYDIEDGTERIINWVTQRLNYLDNKYNYNNI